jgi:cytochrome P450
MAAVDYAPFAEHVRSDPFSHYRVLRDEAPVHWSDEPPGWVISRYDDVVEVLKRPETFSSDAMASVMMGLSPAALLDPASDPEAMRNILALAEAMPFDRSEMAGPGRGRSLIGSDPPHHDVLRRIVNRGFSPRRMAAWEPRIRELVDECMAKLRRGDEFDLVRDLAVPVPTVVISELLGVEAERREDFKRWSDGIISGLSGSGRRAGWRESGVVQTMGEFAEYFVGVAEQRRREPRDDLASVLLAAEGGEEGLRPMELVTFALLLLVAGNETTTNLLGNTVNALLDNPDQLALVQRDPGLVPNLVEEGLRFDGPVQFLFRRTTGEVEIAGTRIPANQVVVPLLGSANRDERRWGRDSEHFDVTRDTRGHVAFGFGVHFCLGASLARLEARCALEALVSELPLLRRREPVVEYIDSTLMRGPRRLGLVAARP